MRFSSHIQFSAYLHCRLVNRSKLMAMKIETLAEFLLLHSFFLDFVHFPINVINFNIVILFNIIQSITFISGRLTDCIQIN